MKDFDIKKVRSCFGLASKTLPKNDGEVTDYTKCVHGKEMIAPIILEGYEVYNTLCPVSKLTGHRESPLSLLGKISGADSVLLNSVLQELPTIASDPRLTDEDRVAMVVDRFSSGSPAEDAIMAEKLMRDIDALGLSAKNVDVPPTEEVIKFNEIDAPKSE